MELARSLLLWASQNPWLRRRVPRMRFVRAATRRFMPGETLDDAIAATRRFAAQGLPTTLTQLGENVRNREEAEAVSAHYVAVLDRIASERLDAEVSVKLTHLGLDLDPEIAFRNLEPILAGAGERWVWIDMEGSRYVDGTIGLYRRALAKSSHVGLCLQAYLHRTPTDLEGLLSLTPSVRLVKGAYREPKEVAIQSRAEIGRTFLALATRILEARSRDRVSRFALATHDVPLISRIDVESRTRGWPLDRYEIQMLYGIRQADQLRYAKSGRPTRCLITYGVAWYPWYVRRLAERPSNVLFVLRNLVARTPVEARP